jgi:hypothetical protein
MISLEEKVAEYFPSERKKHSLIGGKAGTLFFFVICSLGQN